MIELKSVDGDVLFTSTKETKREALIEAVSNSFDLTGVDLRCLELTNMIISHAKMANADLTGSVLRDVTLSHSTLRGANLTKVTVCGGSLRSSDISNANLTDSTLFGVSVAYAKLSGANLTNANFSCCDMGNSVLRNCSLKHSLFECVNIRYADLEGAMIDDAIVHRITELGPIGSRSAKLIAFHTDNGLLLSTGCCVQVTESVFRDKVEQKHWGKKHMDHYLAALDFLNTLN